MKGVLRTRRWSDPAEPGDGLRILICRFRPRGLPTAKETWDEWWKELGPSPGLLAAFQGKDGPPIGFDVYRERFTREMAAPGAKFRLQALANRIAAGETVTLLCSASCEDPARCHRTLLVEMVRARLGRGRG